MKKFISMLLVAAMGGFASGEVKLNDKSIKGKSVRAIRDMGLAYIAEDRMVYGVAGEMSIKMNIVADRFDKKEFKNGLFLNQAHVNEVVDKYIKEFEIACDGRDQPVRMVINFIRIAHQRKIEKGEVAAK